MRKVIFKEWIRGIETEEYKNLKGSSRFIFSGVKFIEGTNCYTEEEGLLHGFFTDSDDGASYTSAIIERKDGSIINVVASWVRFIDTPEPSTIDWEQRRWEASVAAMQGLLANSTYTQNLAVEERRGTSVFVKILSKESIEIADTLIEEFKKHKQ